MICLRAGLAAVAVATFGHVQGSRAADAGPCDRTTWLGLPAEPGNDYAGSRAALVDMLSRVPDTAEGRAGSPMLSYVDLDALVAAGLHKVAPDADLGSVPLNDALMTLIRVSAGPQDYLTIIHSARDTMADVIGVGPVDIRRGLDFGMPPAHGMVLGLAPGGDYADAVGSALAARGFDQRLVDDVPVWHRLEDNEIDIANRMPEDPFGGRLGRSSRLFLFDDALAGAPAWPLAEQLVAAATGGAPSFADDPTFCALAAAVTDPSLTGELLQFMLLDPKDLMFGQPQLVVPDGADLPTLAAPEAQAGSLPPYRMAALADRFTGARDVALIALAFRDAETAAAAGTVVAERLASFRPMSVPEVWQRLLADFNAEISATVLTPVADGPAIALVSVAYDSQFPTDETEDGLRRQGGRLFVPLVQAIFNRELTPLVVDSD